MRSCRRASAGATLLVTLIMLVMLTLFAISAMNTSTTNLQVVGNMQLRGEALGATNGTLERAVSTTDFVNSPGNAIPNPCDGLPNTTCTDMNADGKYEYVTKLDPPPRCTMGRVVKVGELKISSPTAEDVACLQAQQQGTFAVAGAQSTGDSLCGWTVWDVNAVTTTHGSTATTTDVKYAATLGVGVRVKALDVETQCP